MLERTSSLSSVLIIGDMNVHLNVLDRAVTVKFNALLTTHGFTQHVQSSTHVGGHLLDVFLVRQLLTRRVDVSQPGGLSDHSMIVGHIAWMSQFKCQRLVFRSAATKYWLTTIEDCHNDTRLLWSKVGRLLQLGDLVSHTTRPLTWRLTSHRRSTTCVRPQPPRMLQTSTSASPVRSTCSSL